MMNFNAAARKVCIVRKASTNSPLQALTLMNNVTFVETSRLLAERMLHEGDSLLADQVAFGFRLATGRRSNSRELDLLCDAFHIFRAKYENEPEAAQKLLAVGDYPHDKTLAVRRLAAMTMVASAIMNLDEVVTKE